jgi:predicted SPOUT superfamily RNA methylase MTH1
MSQPPRLKTPHSDITVSIAIPGSFVSNAQTRELQTQLAGQVSRAAAVYRVDEVVVYDDGLGTALNSQSNYRRGPPPPSMMQPTTTTTTATTGGEEKDGGGGDDDRASDRGGGDPPPPRERRRERPSTDPHVFLARVLQYVECPQYLRRKLFPMHPDLQFAGLLPPLDAPHHLRRGEVSRYREGVVVGPSSTTAAAAAGGGTNDDEGDGVERRGGGVSSLVDCGVPNRLVRIDRELPPGIRCTVRLDPRAYHQKSSSSTMREGRGGGGGGGGGIMEGEVVSPTAPRDEDGTYWGYAVRMASSINAIFAECPYPGGYDLKVGTSERGDVSIDDPKFCLRKRRKNKTKEEGGGGEQSRRDDGDEEDGDDYRFNHLLIVFGGVAGIEESVDADESMTLPGEESGKLFDVWVNICPYQGSRTIRTEEALFIALARLSPFIARNGSNMPRKMTKSDKGGTTGSSAVAQTEDVEFSDEVVSEESSDEE